MDLEAYHAMEIVAHVGEILRRLPLRELHGQLATDLVAARNLPAAARLAQIRLHMVSSALQIADSTAHLPEAADEVRWERMGAEPPEDGATAVLPVVRDGH